MAARLFLLTALGLAACSFQSDGVPIGGDVDAEIPPDACIPSAETCEGTDQDCDGNIDEGLTSGAACDGPDLDLCMDDQIVCDTSGAEICGNTSGDDNAELCNAFDDDCDGEMDEGFAIGSACDGPDGDVCLEGTNACGPDGLALVCSDTTDTIVETCNNADDDCDGVPDNGFDLVNDTQNCGECGNQCTNALGTTSCMTSACVPVCTNGAANCDLDANNGCELQDTNPTCLLTSATPAATVSGDVDTTAMVTGTTEAFVRIRIVESSAGPDIDITAQLALTSGTGTDYDLHVYCPSCGSTPISDADDIVEVGRSDVTGQTRSFDVFAEIRYNPASPSTTCAAWTLNVTGHAATANRCGN